MRTIMFLLLALASSPLSAVGAARAEPPRPAEITVTASEWRYYGLPRVVYYSRYRVKGRVCRWPLGGIAVCLDQGRYGSPPPEERLVCRYTSDRPHLWAAYHGLGLEQAYECRPKEARRHWRRNERTHSFFSLF